MMSAFPEAKSRSSIWRTKSPGLAEFAKLIDLLPEAAFLVDVPHQQIMAANPILAKMTAFPPNELTGATLKKLFTEPDQIILGLGSKKLVNVQRCKRSPLAVEVEVNSLDAANNWLVVTLLPSQRKIRATWHQDVFRGVHMLAEFSEIGALEIYLNKAVAIIQNILDTGMVCIYQANSGSPGMQKIAASETLFQFPDTIPPLDLIRLQSGTVWFPGKRVMTEIHRTGRLVGLNYVASTPLGHGRASDGLLVVADSEKQPMDNLLNLMEVFGALLGQAIQYYIFMANLKIELANKQDQLFIHQVMMENSKSGIIILDPDLKIMDLNPAIEWLLGYSKIEARGQTIENILIGADHLLPALQTAQDGIPTHNINENQLHNRHGQTFPVAMQVIPAQIEGKLQAILILVTDVSENVQNRALTQQLEQRAVLGDVSAVFAHEVRNPINGISLTLQLMATRLPENDPNQESIHQMQAECTRLSHLMESVLAFSRPLEPRFETVELGKLIKVLLDRWHPRFARVNILPFFRAEEGLPPIKGDPRALDQVITNLISNSVDAMRTTGGSLSVNVRQDNSLPDNPQIEITVSDDGPGIPEELILRVFEPFVTNSKRGTGLGLAITKRIVTAHKGSIAVSSIPGATIFTVLFPVE
jgi:two-component system sensor histidine kinase AtoS